MYIRNTTRETDLCADAERAASFWRRLRGLMFRNNLPHGGGLLLEPEWSIHTFFMRFPIDVVFLDREYIVLSVHEAVSPNRIGPMHRDAYAVLELPTGTIERTGTQPGDQLSVVAQ